MNKALKFTKYIYIGDVQKSFEMGNAAVAFGKIDLESPITEQAKLCLSVMTHPRIRSMHSKQTGATVDVLEREIAFRCIQSNNAVNDGRRAP